MIGTVSMVLLFAIPFGVVVALGLASWFREALGESLEGRVVQMVTAAFALSGLASAGALVQLIRDGEAVSVPFTWFFLDHYTFTWSMLGDWCSLLLAIWFGLLLGVVGLFSRRYLHREHGFFRFYFLIALFGSGVMVLLLAGNLDVLFVGWEVVGLTSALLIAFFHERRRPVENGLRAFLIYRLCDVGLLASLVWLHHATGTTDFQAPGASGWYGLPVPSDPVDATIVGLLLLWATMGKSALVPLGGWLPRAMEGPTPSSAIFYGAISVHLGPYLLLRAAPILEASVVVRVAVIVLGLLTAGHATFVGRVQSDIKSALAYASMTQVGLIFAEIGLGLHTLALVHILGHAALRSLQILRSPSLLRDYTKVEQAMGSVLPKTGGHLEKLVPRRLQPWLYRHALERGYFDDLLGDWVVGGFVRVFRGLDGVDQRFTAWIAGRAPKQGSGSGEVRS